MLRFLKKKRLEAKGLSCGKTRRSAGERDTRESLEASPYIRVGIILIAAALLFLFSFADEAAEPLRHFLYAVLILAFAVIQPWLSRESPVRDNSKLALYLMIILLQVGVAQLLLYEVSTGYLAARILPLVIPVALAPITLSVLLGSQTALMGTLSGTLWIMILQRDPAPQLMLMGLTGGLSAVLATLRVRRRSRLLRAGFYSGIAVWLVALLSGVIVAFSPSDLSAADWGNFGLESALAIGTGIVTAVIISGSLPLLEQLFGITTEISWLEMADLNHPLLRRLSLEAPGTYHHSLAMANLAESCAERVGANATLCRVSSYFHDIGKLAKPEYFTENMPSGENPHDELTPTMSALVILSHVKEGVDLALRNKLNRRVIDAIQQHHGTSVVEYFYQKACMQERDARAGGTLMNVRPEDIPKVSEESFRYPGPKPQSIETVILGLADAAESASRSLERPTPQRLDDLVHDILQDRIDDGQYDEAPVTLCQLQEIAATLVASLGSMHHSRIAYGRRKDDKHPVGKD